MNLPSLAPDLSHTGHGAGPFLFGCIRVLARLREAVAGDHTVSACVPMASLLRSLPFSDKTLEPESDTPVSLQVRNQLLSGSFASV